jgi:hypothetical protein
VRSLTGALLHQDQRLHLLAEASRLKLRIQVSDDVRMVQPLHQPDLFLHKIAGALILFNVGDGALASNLPLADERTVTSTRRRFNLSNTRYPTCTMIFLRT